jgi:arsenical pump membrane protein
VNALPYLFICAFIANAASFVLPISNPANLVVYGKQIPHLVPWLRVFLLPSTVSIGVTYLALRWISRKDLAGTAEVINEAAQLSSEGRVAAWAIVGSGVILLCASGLGIDLGLPTLIAAFLAVAIATRVKGRALVEIGRNISWSVLPLVAGLFVLVEGLNRAGARELVGNMLLWCEQRQRFAGSLAASFGIAVLSNVMNNLPSGLLAGGALQTLRISSNIRNAVLVGVDLGPNLSVTGSLATILWLIALRREGERISGWRFLRAGALVMFPALLLATLAAS